MIFKVIITKTICVEADNEEEAEDMVFNGCEAISEEERITKVVPIKKGCAE